MQLTPPARAGRVKARTLGSIAGQSSAQLGGVGSVLSRQRREHFELERLLDGLTQCTPEESGPLLMDLRRLVFPHAFAEEVLLWPLVRRIVPNGHDLTLEVEREHQAINQLMTRMEILPRGSAEWREALQRAARLLVKDARDEEEHLLPELQERLSPQQLRVLGALWSIVRRIAPTRPHPIISRRPPGNVLAALPLTLLDRTRDRIDLRRYRPGGHGPVSARISAALTRAAHVAEHLPGLRLGEHPATKVAAPAQVKWRAMTFAAVALGAALLIARRGGSSRPRLLR